MARKAPYHRRVEPSRFDAQRGAPGALPDEALDALATILDEIRSAGSRSRSELVGRTGLSRGIVA